MTWPGPVFTAGLLLLAGAADAVEVAQCAPGVTEVGQDFATGLQRAGVEQICLDQAEARMFRSIVEKSRLTGREIIDPHNGAAARQQAVGQSAADESGAAGDECPHVRELGHRFVMTITK